MIAHRAILATLILPAVFLRSVDAGDSRTEIVERVKADIKYLSSDELEGRGVETAGIELAASRILADFEKYGLKPGMPDGTYRQPFDIVVGQVQVAKETKLQITVDGATTELNVGKDFQPLQRGGSGTAESELVFVGYGITSEEDKYDDYANIDVEGKVVVILRREPQQGTVDGAFRGTETSNHSYIDTKLKLAIERKAAGIVFVNDPFSSPSADRDELTTPGGFGTVGAGIPFAHVKQSAVNALLKAAPLTVTSDGKEVQLSSLSEIGSHIDKTLTPISQSFANTKASLVTKFESQSIKAYNLIGVIEGEGELADETIIVGGHYDHIGLGGIGSRARNRRGEIHNGADDNATGTAAVLEIARRVASGPKPKRRIVFICFSGEERGLLGSKYYVTAPAFPLDKTVAMLNFDMIGTLRNNLVEVNGVGTAKEFAAIVDAVDEESPLNTKRIDTPFAGSDHLPFFQNQIPVMFCFTGITPRYHTPDDDFETINVEGVVSVIDFTEGMLRRIDDLPEPPQFNELRRGSRRRRQIPFLGIVPNIGIDDEEAGIPLQSVRPDSPAQKGGLQTGDALLKVDDKDLNNFADLITVLQSKKPKDVLAFSVKRGEETVEVKVTLGAPR